MVRIFRHDQAFTLIELLIVVAIIAILAAIAVPNFLEAQTRAKVSRSKSDMRTLATALEAYHIDNNYYPINQHSYCDKQYGSWTDQYGFQTIDHRRGRTVAGCCWRLTTPIAYISSIETYASPFWPNQKYYDWSVWVTGPSASYLNVGATYLFGACNGVSLDLPTVRMARTYPEWPASGMMSTSHHWFLYGPGPSALVEKESGTFWIDGTNDKPYDPTNGTVSLGQIVRTD